MQSGERETSVLHGGLLPTRKHTKLTCTPTYEGHQNPTSKGTHMGNDILRSARIKRGWTQLALAIAANCDRASVSLLEAGKRPSRRTAEKIAGALGMNPKRIWPEFETLSRF